MCCTLTATIHARPHLPTAPQVACSNSLKGRGWPLNQLHQQGKCVHQEICPLTAYTTAYSLRTTLQAVAVEPRPQLATSSESVHGVATEEPHDGNKATQGNPASQANRQVSLATVAAECMPALQMTTCLCGGPTRKTMLANQVHAERGPRPGPQLKTDCISSCPMCACAHLTIPPTSTRARLSCPTTRCPNVDPSTAGKMLSYCAQ
jgi:hypothetical protein